MIVKKTKKYRIEREDGLIDNCKYMLYMAEGWTFCGGEDCMPCKSIKEAMEFVKEASFDDDYEKVRDMAETDFIMWMNDYEVSPLSDFDELSDNKKEFYFKCIKAMIKKCTKMIDREALAFEKRIKKK